jgi:hypothetical protein
MDSSRERRWIILGEDGRYVTLGRDSDPTEDELAKAEGALQAQGLAGWLAIMEGNPHTVAQPVLMMVRPLADPASTFEKGTAAFRSRRVE